MDDLDYTPPTLGAIRRHNGVAGAVSYSVPVTYEDEPEQILRFVGNVAGGPVIMVTGTGRQTFVDNVERHGKFSREWVEKFFA